MNGAAAVPIHGVAAYVLDCFPALRNAVQSDPDEIVPGRFPIPNTIRFDGPLVLPEITRFEHLFGPIAIEGDCLSQMIPGGRHRVWVNPRRKPEPGDLVLVQAGPRTLAQLLEAAAQDAEWCAKYRTGIPDVWLKSFARWNGVSMMLANNSAMPLGDCRVLGVVRKIADA